MGQFVVTIHFQRTGHSFFSFTATSMEQQICIYIYIYIFFFLNVSVSICTLSEIFSLSSLVICYCMLVYA